MAVQVGKLKRLVIDEQKHAALRRKQRIESSLGGHSHSPFQFCFQYAPPRHTERTVDACSRARQWVNILFCAICDEMSRL
jgi:hypothetical protein